MEGTATRQTATGKTQEELWRDEPLGAAGPEGSNAATSGPSPEFTTGDELAAMPVEEPEGATSPETPDAKADEDDEPKPLVSFPLPAATSDAPPRWVKLPRGFKFPRNLQVMFIRFPAAMTRAAEKGDRQCALWELSDIDERAAFQRCQGDPNRVAGEMAKQMVRLVDGRVADWGGSGGPDDIDLFWREIGAKGRSQLIRLFTQLHVLSRKEQADFFANCVAVRSTG